MLAILHVPVPFTLVLPGDVEFDVSFRYQVEDGTVVVEMPPMAPEKQEHGLYYSLDDQPAFATNVLRIDFFRERFSPNPGEPDPPVAVLQAAINALVQRLRFATHSHNIRPVDLGLTGWQVHYVNDDESPLPDGELPLSKTGAQVVSLAWTVIDPVVWSFKNSLGESFQSPIWHSILMDARAQLPNIGAAVVLAATALEVFIGQTLANLSNTRPELRPFYDWVMNREGNHDRRPSVEEEFRDVLKIYTGRSLTEDNRLWSDFKELKNARNKYTHEGEARVHGKPLELARARELVNSALQIALKVRSWLPTEHQWPVPPSVTRKVTLTKTTPSDETETSRG